MSVADGAIFDAGETRLVLSLIREEGDERLGRYEATDEGDLQVSLALSRANCAGSSWRRGPGVVPRMMRPAEAQRLVDDTAHFWHDWVSQSTYAGRWREELERSAITLKLLTYAPTGALVAAPTAGLPEQIGGERNWDYRYTWVRDGSFSVHTLVRMGFVDEAARLQPVAPRPCHRAAGGRHRPAGHHVPRRRQPRSPRGGPAGLGGLSRLVPCADRKRSRRATPTGHLRRSARRHLLPRQCRSRDRAARMARHLRTARVARRQLGPAGRRDLGDPGRTQGLHLRKTDVLGRVRPGHPTRDSAWPAGAPRRGGSPSATRSTTRSWTRAGAPNARHSSSNTARPFSTPHC